LRNWISGTGSRPAAGQADGAADNAFLRQAGVEHPRRPVLLRQALRHPVDAAFGTDILSEDQHARVGAELLVERPADRGGHGDAGAIGARLVMRGGRGVAVPPLPAFLLQLAFEEDVAHHAGRLRHRPRLGPRKGTGDLGLRFLADAVPFGLVNTDPSRKDLSLGSGSRRHSSSTKSGAL
jgi:hypothetical protein